MTGGQLFDLLWITFFGGMLIGAVVMAKVSSGKFL